MKKYNITYIILANGVKQEPKNVDLYVNDLKQFREEVKKENPHYDVLFIYKDILTNCIR